MADNFQNMLADLDARINAAKAKPLLNPNLPQFGSSANIQTGDYNPVKGGSSGDTDPLWMKALTGLSSTGKLITDNLANISSGDWSDNIFTQAWKGMTDSWGDGKLGWGDIPAFGSLYGIGKYGKGFGETLDNTGITQRGSAASKWGGLAGDILLDPINLVTFGGASAVKAGAKAAEIAAKELATGAGLAIGKNAAKDVPEMLANAYKAKWQNVPDIDPYQLSDIAKSISSDAATKITDAGKAARAQAQNALFSLDLPFTNMTKQFGSKPDFLKIADAKVGATGAAAAGDLFRKVGLNPDDPAHAADISKLLKEKFGVSSAEDLTTQGLRHLQDEINKISGYSKEFNPKVTLNQIATDLNPMVSYNKFNVDDILSKLRNPRYGADFLEKFGLKGAPTERLATEGADIADHQASKLHELSNSYNRPSIYNQTDDLRTLSDGLRGAENTASIKYDPTPVYKQFETKAAADGMNAERVAANMQQFIQDMGGKSKLGAAVGRINPFNPREFKSEDAMARHSAGDLRDAQSRISGLTRHTNNDLKEISDSMKDLSTAERRAIPYFIEDAFPRSFDKNSVDVTKMQAIADRIKTSLATIGNRDIASGAVARLRKNYFPHVMKPGMEGTIEDPKIAALLGKNQTTGFGKDRTGFESLAQLDDAIETLKKNGDMEQATRLENLFEREPVEALGNRAYESIKTSAMSDLYKQLESDGLIVKKTLDETNIDRGFNAANKNYHTLSKEEAGALGLPSGTQVHPDVFEGMKEVRDLFTVKGFQNVVDNINRAVSVWKSLVTSYVPAHYTNNFIGNIANNTLAGVKPKSYSEAAGILKAAKGGKLSDEQQKVMMEAYENGVFGQGYSSEFVRSRFSGEKTGKMEKFADAMTHNKYAQWMRERGDQIDDFSRMALFLHGKEATGSAKLAGKMVSKYLFNYNIQNNADKIVRSVVPFWTWTKNNLPLQIQGLMQQPRYYQTYQKVRETFNEDVNPAEGNEYQTQDYLHIPGTGFGMPLRALPMNDLSRFTSDPLETMRKFMGDLSPVVKDPFEVSLNKQIFNNRPIYYPDDNPLAKVAQYGLRQTGLPSKLADVGQSEGGGDFLQNLAALITGKPIVYDK